MKKFVVTAILMISFLFFLPASGYTQTQTDIAELKKISYLEGMAFKARKKEALEFAKKHSIPVFISRPGTSFAELQYIDEYGKPQYSLTDNSNAAQTISTNQVYSGGNAGLSLTGAGITARIWDAGAVRLTHQEFNGRVVQGDGAPTMHYHSCHVAGTIMASGVVSSSKGMAPEAQLRAFDWNSDASEMAAEATNGMLISSHSYGYVRGWYYGSTWTWYGNPAISTTEDYLFGFYDSQAQSWDNIARNAPNYLICKSAGNDRNEGPAGGPYPLDGPYDCIAHAGIAKNILTVGAVNDIAGGYTGPSSVVMSSFSCWGPADDGRIKPDIVANGIGLYSTDIDSDTDYKSLSGTSMSTPSAAGSLALLQQHWNNLNPGSYMLASTLKALVLHTADEAGASTGPDYQFGWGLMNTQTAALKISEDQSFNVIEELVLNDDGSYTREIQSDGTQPLKVTICWTDVAGTPVSAQLDPVTPMLVNDLDLRLTYSEATFYPWKLDPANPSAPATNNSENNVDNVETVYIESPEAGIYTITVDHDGTLSGGSQAFSIIISGAVYVEPGPYISLPYAENFETGFGEWQQAAYDDFDWARISGDTPTTKTSPKKAYSGSYYIYTEASTPQGPGNEACLEATFSFTGVPNPEISLWYHMFGNQMGTLHIDVYWNGTWTNDFWFLSGQQQSNDKQPWRNALISLLEYGNQDGVKIRIRGTIGSGEKSDICVDLVEVRQQGTNAPSGPMPLQDQEQLKSAGELSAKVFCPDNIILTSNDHIINIFHKNNETFNGQLRIYNMMGQLMMNKEINGDSNYSINLQFKPGLYIIKLLSGNGIISRKVIIE